MQKIDKYEDSTHENDIICVFDETIKHVFLSINICY